MASPLPSPAIPILAPPSAVQLVSKQLAAHIDALRAARLHFAQGVADLASRDGFFAATVPSSSSSSNANNQSIQQQQPPANAILDLLRPMLVSDPSPPVAAAAVSCLARIMQAASSGTLTSDKKQTRGKAWAESIVLGGEVGRGTVKAVVGIVEGSVQMVEEGSARKSGRAHGEDHAATLKYLRRASLLLLRHLAAHPSVLPTLLECGLASAVVRCLADETDKDVREQGAWCLGIVGRTGKDFAQHVADAGCFPVLSDCLKEAELSVRKTACAAIADILKWDPELATSFLSTTPNPLPQLAAFLRSPSPPLRTQSLSLLTHIAKHPTLAEKTVLTTGVAKAAVMSLHPSRGPRERWAGVCWCAEIARAGNELAKLLVDAGAASLLVACVGKPIEINLTTGQVTADPAVPAIATLGHVAGYSALLAHACISSGAVQALALLLESGSEATMAAKESAAWALAQICKWSPAHLAESVPCKIPENLLRLGFEAQDGMRYLRAFGKIVKSLDDASALISCSLALPAPSSASAPTMLSILTKLLPLLSASLQTRKELVRRGALGKILEFETAGSGDDWKLALRNVKACFPEEVVRYYTPGYSASLLSKLDEPAKRAQTPEAKMAPRPQTPKVEAQPSQTQQHIAPESEPEPEPEVFVVEASFDLPESAVTVDTVKVLDSNNNNSEGQDSPRTAIDPTPLPIQQSRPQSRPSTAQSKPADPIEPRRDQEDQELAITSSFISLAFRPVSATSRHAGGSIDYIGQVVAPVEVKEQREVQQEHEAVQDIREQAVSEPEPVQQLILDVAQVQPVEEAIAESMIESFQHPEPEFVAEPAPVSPDRPFAQQRNSQLQLETEEIKDDSEPVNEEEQAQERQPVDEQQEEEEGDEDDYQSSVDYTDVRARDAEDSEEELFEGDIADGREEEGAEDATQL